MTCQLLSLHGPSGLIPSGANRRKQGASHLTFMRGVEKLRPRDGSSEPPEPQATFQMRGLPAPLFYSYFRSYIDCFFGSVGFPFFPRFYLLSHRLKGAPPGSFTWDPCFDPSLVCLGFLCHLQGGLTYDPQSLGYTHGLQPD
jgi:hypothetical protein